jgi:predicted flap endonuclease-1-like 5' DNA nuclease
LTIEFFRYNINIVLKNKRRNQMTSLKLIEGIGPAFAKKLADAGVGSTEALLKAGGTKKGRKDLEVTAGVSQKLILEWVNHADLFRIKGIGGQYADLLEEAGVDSVPELAMRKADALTEKMKQVNEKKNLVNRPPSEKEVQKWIASAKKMKRAIEY